MADDKTTRGPRVRLIGRAQSSEAFELRDFLQRSVVAFDWVKLTGDDDAQRPNDEAANPMRTGRPRRDSRCPVTNARIFWP
jgi:hypothetical protein